jgi:tRNA modification GTPase
MPTRDDDENCAILMTPPGAAAIAVVRLVGPGVHGFLKSHFSRTVVPGRPVHGEIRDVGGVVIDDPVVVLHDSRPLADVSLHGGTWVVRAFLELARRDGFRSVEPVEAPLDERAVDASSVIETEVLTHLPLARTELALRVLLAQPRAWDRLKRRMSHVRREEIERIVADRALYWLLHPPRIAIVGVANAGKSTLANQLFAQERSITADLPGTTRDWVGDVANVDGLAVMLVDTPGLRETRDALEAEAIALAMPQIERADLVVLVLDQARPLAGEQEQLLARFRDSMVVANKTDRPAAWAAPARAIRTVATTGQGVDELRRAIRRHFAGESLEIDRPRWWTERQRAILQRSVSDPANLSEL